MSKQRNDQDEQQTPSQQEPNGPDQENTETDSTPPSSDSAESTPGSSSEQKSRSSGAASSSQESAQADKHATGDDASSSKASASGQSSRQASSRKKAPPSASGKSKSSRSQQAGGKSDSAKRASSQASGESSTSSSAASRTSSSSGAGGQSGARQPSDSQGGGGGNKTGIIALVLVIVLAVGALVAGWWGWQRLDQQEQRLAQMDANAEAISELETRLEESNSERQSEMDEALSSLRNDFDDYRSEMNSTLDDVLEDLSSEQDTDEREWLHAEAAYLLRLANQRLQLERDAEGAAALLRTADERLREADNPALTPVRREIASELAELESVPKVDRTGLYLSLNAQQEQLAGLPLKQDVEAQTVEGEDGQGPTGGWQEQLAHFGAELKDLVTVRRHDQALEALISPEQESYLRQNVRLLIEQAQLALLKEEEALYEASLEKAINLVETYYDTERDGVQSVLDRLASLREEAVRPELPDISGSQQALSSFIERRFENDGDREADEQGDEE